MAARMFKPQRLGDDKMYKLPFFYYMLFILFFPYWNICLAFSMEQNQRVSSVSLNTNVRNGTCERLSWGSRAGGWGKEEWSRPQLSLRVAAASGALARLDTFSPNQEYPPLPIPTQQQSNLVSLLAWKDLLGRRLTYRTYMLCGSGETHHPLQASFASSAKREEDTLLTFRYRHQVKYMRNYRAAKEWKEFYY